MSDYVISVRNVRKGEFGAWDHSWHVGDKRFADDLAHTLRGDIDRRYIPTRSVVDAELQLI